MQMHENKIEETVKAILIAVDTGEFDAERSLAELEELARTAKAEVVAKVTQKRPSLDVATCLGTGRLEETAELCKSLEPDLIIFDHELTATQIRNIEKILEVHTIDRTMLILDIFASRAITSEGKLQVELAQQKYRLPRLAGIGISLSRLGGGIGTRGPGETKLETDKRHIRRRITFLEDELKELKKKRELVRKRRKKDGVTSVAIVGYTNAGKSTLLNTLTGAGVLAENKLFATLDVTARGLELPDGRTVLLSDTVGLISRLPHHLVEAFKSTLEEAANSDLIVNVIDASDKDALEKTKVTEKLLSELGCDGIPKVNVLNKCDLVPADDIAEDFNTVKISAKNGAGLERFLQVVADTLPATSKRMKLLIPFSNGQIISKIRQEGKVFSEEYTSDGTLIDALVDHKLYSAVDEYKV